MASVPTDALPPSAWRSIWRHPGDTILRILSRRSTRLVLPLAALGAIASWVGSLLNNGYTVELLDWRLFVAVAVGGAAFGIASVYVQAALLGWSGRLLDGQTNARDLRAVIAWAGLPSILGVAFCFAVLVVAKFSGFGATRSLGTALAAVAMIVALWSLVTMLIMLARVQKFGIARTLASAFLGLLMAWAVWAVLAFAIRSFLFQPFSIPAGSMMPTLLIGDHVFVSKYSYGYSRFSLPFSLPLWSGRVLATEPERGDLVVFRLPKDVATDYVKRVVGLPGDRIQVIDGVLQINGEPVRRERVEDFVETERGYRVKRWRETLPNGVSYDTLDLQDNGFLDNTQVYAVPPGHYFMLGDNRDNSTDSRVLSQVGYVPFENLVGRARIVFLSIDRESASHSGRPERLGLLLR